MHRGYVAKPPSERFWAKVDRTTGPDACWLWRGGLTHDGYGQFYLGRDAAGHDRAIVAHRFAYQDVVGAIPEGLDLDHVRERGCVSRACVNPSHLEPVTAADNRRRGTRVGGGMNKGRLSPALVAELRGRAAGGESYRALAREVRVHHGTISRAVRGVTWTEVSA